MLDELKALIEERLKELEKDMMTNEGISDDRSLDMITRQITKKLDTNLRLMKTLNLPDFEKRLEKMVRESVDLVTRVTKFFGFLEKSNVDEEALIQEMLNNIKGIFMNDKKEASTEEQTEAQ